MKLRVLQSLKRTLIALITMLGLFTVSNITAQTVEAKELTEVVTLLQHLDQSDGTVAPNASGGYDLRTGQAYKLRLVFDLKKYNGDLVDGDYFTFNFPAPMSIISNTTQLIDPKTGVNIGEVVITGNGANLGGTAKVTLKNLEAYRLATGEDIIKDISGNFATTFIFRTDQNKVVINYDSASLVDPVSYTYSAVTNTGTVEGYENFAKMVALPQKKRGLQPVFKLLVHQVLGNLSLLGVSVSTMGHKIWGKTFSLQIIFQMILSTLPFNTFRNLSKFTGYRLISRLEQGQLVGPF